MEPLKIAIFRDALNNTPQKTTDFYNKMKKCFY